MDNAPSIEDQLITKQKLAQLLKDIKKLEVGCFLSGENDALNIYLEVHAGAGGTESQDWAEM